MHPSQVSPGCVQVTGACMCPRDCSDLALSERDAVEALRVARVGREGEQGHGGVCPRGEDENEGDDIGGVLEG